MLQLYAPRLDELWFRREFLSDPKTMSYNRAWGGTVPFPEEVWAAWYDKWLVHHENRRFYRYLRDGESFVGEIAYHYDADMELYLADIIIPAKYRGRGYGGAGLKLLCEAAKANGLRFLYDDIAADNPAAGLFLRNGFTEEYRTDEIIMLKKEL